MRYCVLILLVGCGVCPFVSSIDAADATDSRASVLPEDLPVTRISDVIYGRKHGMALLMDVYSPKQDANGIGIVLVISAGWTSDFDQWNGALVGHFVPELIKRGYTVFAVVHGSQPKFTIPEAVEDIDRAVRFIRHHAGEYGIDPERIGITGASAGGHLSLMQGTAGDEGNAQADDPVERESSRVQAVACLFPPTDFHNYGAKDKPAFGREGLLAQLQAVVDVREPDAETRRFDRISVDEHRQMLTRISPITHVTPDDPPTLIIHGDHDQLVPIGQAEAIVDEFQEQGVKTELLVRPGRGHDFKNVEADVAEIADWFDAHLKSK